MSDGDKDATRNYPRASGTSAGQLTAWSPSSAPWERFSETTARRQPVPLAGRAAYRCTPRKPA